MTQVTRGGRAQVVGWSLIGRKASQVSRRSSEVYHGGRAVVVVLGLEFIPIELRTVCEGRELACLLLYGRKSFLLLLLGQIYTFCLLVYQSLPEIDVNAS